MTAVEPLVEARRAEGLVLDQMLKVWKLEQQLAGPEPVVDRLLRQTG